MTKIVIDKESIIKVFTVAFYAVSGGDYNTVKDAVKELFEKIDYEPYEEQPTQCEWIPVSERLPDDMQKVLVWFEYYRYGDYNCMYQTYGFCYVIDGEWSPLINGETGWQDARIIAWMPLPEPYKEEENE